MANYNPPIQTTATTLQGQILEVALELQRQTQFRLDAAKTTIDIDVVLAQASINVPIPLNVAISAGKIQFVAIDTYPISSASGGG